VETAAATDAAVIIQVGRDLYVSDPALAALWTPGQTRPGECPFPGLDPFGPGQAEWFFGRQKLTGDLLQMLDEKGPGLFLVVGPSGAGKSSLLGAGLLAAIGEGRLPVPGSDSWPRLMITPGAHPSQTLHDALATSARARASQAVIVVDRLEEIFTACDDEAERTDFLDALAGTGGLVVAGLRADFYARATGYPALRAAMQSRQVVLGAMTPAEVRDAIALPARSAGLTLDDGLVERLLRDLGVDEVGGYEAGRLPLLAHALRATWQRRSGDRLTIAGYEATGGIHGAIAKTAEDVYTDLDEAGQRAARHLFLSLIRIGDGEGTADTRRRVSTESLYAQVPDPDATRAVLAAFTGPRARLLTSGEQTVEITHEALLRRWPRLRDWISEDRAGNLIRQGVEEAAAAWDHEGRDQAALYGGARLAAARTWSADPEHQRELSPPARDFLAASDRRRRRGARRRNEIIAVLAALLVALGGLTAFAFNQRDTAQAQRAQAVAENRISESAVLAAQSTEAMSNNNPQAGLEFAIESERLNPSSLQSANALLDAQSSRFVARLAESGDKPSVYAESVAYDPRGGLMATSTFTGYVRLWSASSHQLLWEQRPDGPDAIIHRVAFTPNGLMLVSTEPDGIRLWRVAGPARLVPVALLRTTAGISSLAISPDGKTLAFAGDNGGVQLWNVARSSLVSVAQGTVPAPFDPALAVSPNGLLLAFAAPKDKIDLWSLTSHRLETTPLSTGPNATDALAFSPDSALLASGDIVGGVKLWDVYDQPALLDTLSGHNYGVNQVAFSPDGGTLASASDDLTVALWNVLGDTLDSRAQYSIAVRFSPDGRLLAVGSNLNNVAQVVLYSMPARRKIATLERAVPGTDTVSTIAFSPNGHVLAAALIDPDNTVQLWDTVSHRLIGEVETHLSATTEIRSMAFSPDGSLLAISSLGSPTVQLWNTTRWTLASTINASADTTGFMGSDGNTVISAGYDGTVRIWNVQNRNIVARIPASSAIIRSMTYSQALGTIVTTDGTVTRVWQTSTTEVAAGICRALGAPVSVRTWNDYVSEYPTYGSAR
jgi:WD40 repeat protein